MLNRYMMEWNELLKEREAIERVIIQEVSLEWFGVVKASSRHSANPRPCYHEQDHKKVRREVLTNLLVSLEAVRAEKVRQSHFRRHRDSNYLSSKQHRPEESCINSGMTF
jgi:hypothetical protein